MTIFILFSNLSEKIPNSEITATQICPDIENSKSLQSKYFLYWSI